MSDLINRDDFINSIVCSVSSPCETKQEQRDAQFKQKYTVDAFIKELKRAPAVDAVEVVHAEWKFDHMTGETAHYADCSICGVHKFFKDVSEYSNFCPNCGAKMGERRESEVSE